MNNYDMEHADQIRFLRKDVNETRQQVNEIVESLNAMEDHIRLLVENYGTAVTAGLVGSIEQNVTDIMEIHEAVKDLEAAVYPPTDEA